MIGAVAAGFGVAHVGHGRPVQALLAFGIAANSIVIIALCNLGRYAQSRTLAETNSFVARSGPLFLSTQSPVDRGK